MEAAKYAVSAFDLPQRDYTAVENAAIDRLRTALALHAASERNAPHSCDNCDGIDPKSCMFKPTPSLGAMRAAERLYPCGYGGSEWLDVNRDRVARIIDAETGAAEAWGLLREARRWYRDGGWTDFFDRIDAALARHEGDKA